MAGITSLSVSDIDSWTYTPAVSARHAETLKFFE